MKTAFMITMMALMAVAKESAVATEYYVDPNGSDLHPGTLDQPFKTIAHAQDVVRRSAGLKNTNTVYLREGIYYLDNTIVFSPEDSGAPDARTTYSSYKGEEVVISGGLKLSLDWKSYKGGILQAETPAGLEIDQLFVNGQRQHMARYPDYNPEIRPYNGYSAKAFSSERAAHWNDPAGGYIHAMHRAHWGGYHYRITGKKPDNTVTYEGGWQNNRQMGMHKSHRFVENIFEELDAPGEWFHNRKTQTLYYCPAEGIDVKTATFEIARLKHLFEFRGNQEKPARHIHLTGLIFRHTVRTFMETKEPLLRSDWTIYRGGAVVFNGAEDCLIAGCEFDQVGGNGIFVNNYNRRITVRGSHIHGAGASAICFVGDPNSVRNPLSEYHQTQSYADIDKTPGPRTDNYPADCVVDDCLIHNISVVEKQAAGVQISMSKGITVRHCSVYDVGRAGINISEGTFGGHVIEFCDVFDTVRETSDHGSFNSWGRDRFWHLKDAPAEELPELAGLDTEKTIIRNSRWRCDHGWDVDLDDGSSHYEIYNNVFLRGGLKLREGFHRKVYNNIAINNSLHPHVWYNNSMDVVTNNIWMGAYRPAGGMPEEQWGKEVDRNLFTSQSDRDTFRDNGCDANSVVGDPLFTDPENGDYRVKDESPALKMGFKNFPMDKFGVQTASLRKLARTPVLPKVRAAAGKVEVSANAAKYWQGATVKELTGEEFSAFGVSKEDGGIHLLTVPADSLAAGAGLEEGDLVQAINGRNTRTIGLLNKGTDASEGKPLKIRFVRGQRTKETVMKKYVYPVTTQDENTAFQEFQVK
jgi:hypothetical protein